MMRYRLFAFMRVFGFLGFAALLTASASASTTPVVRSVGFVTPALLKSSTSVVYYADAITNAVYMLDASRILQPPIGEITRGIDQPVALAVKPDGTLFVSGTSGVTEYASGALSPMHTYRPARGAMGPVAVSADGTLAIGVRVGGPREEKAVLAIYDKGNLVPTRTIVFHLQKNNILVQITALVVDATDNVYASVSRYPDGPSGVIVIPHGSTVQYDTGLPANSGMAFDGAGNFYVADGFGFWVYAPGSNQPSRTITNGVVSAVSPAVAPNGTIFLPNTEHYSGGQIAPGNIVEYLPGGSAPVKALQNSLDQNPVGAAFKPGQ